MSVKTEWVRYGADNQYLGFAAVLENAKTPLPAVIVIQEIWSVDEHIQDVTTRFAEAGYVAFAPDLYAVNGERPETLRTERIGLVKQFLNSVPPSVWHNADDRAAALAKLPEEEQKAIGETFSTLFGGLQMDRYMPQVTATSAFLRETYEPSKGQGVASVGYCMGGSLSALLSASDPDLRGAAVYYGSVLPDEAGIDRITCPVRAFYGEDDVRLIPAIQTFEENMRKAGKSVEVDIYKGANHAFFNDGRPSYEVNAARDALAKTLSFFNEVLGQTSK
ncbi:dienelactone hydrolase family protein [Alicyclobacillus sp. ALC3]|uniref:dienelactone hydrolase family protein n=1 Tax=Alicyclobacillus sp. ALC3 TaxID=2796143 RepID=UPI0023797BBB|nr:dienelactone hydrolase family protein [Alicyclobacillus sp. ALC3]WDL95985.1 dienelactone hydrolase family protein [Alicyclobacillus sp. ALC3]